MLIKGLELFTTAVPPTLPLCLTLGLEFAVKNLKKFGISTINMEKINLAGRVSKWCFDKTGTLTENNMSFYGYLSLEKEMFNIKICKGQGGEGNNWKEI